MWTRPAAGNVNETSASAITPVNGLRARIPLIPAGGINSHEKIQHLLALGAAAVQIGTPFAVCEEGDALKKGLFFRGSESPPFGTAIRPVAELVQYFLTGARPAI